MQPQDVQRAIETHKPYIYDLESMIQELRFGEVNVVLRFHEGFVTDVVLVSKKRKKYTMPDRNSPIPESWVPKPPVDHKRMTTYHSESNPPESTGDGAA